MSAVAASAATAVLAALGVLQALVAAGRPLGRFVWGGRHHVLPRRLRLASAASVVVYGLMAVLLWSRAGVLPGSHWEAVRIGTWVLVGYFVLGIGLNGISRSRAERLAMTPACLVLAVSAATVALGRGA